MSSTSSIPINGLQWVARKRKWTIWEILFWISTLLPFVLFPSYQYLASQIAITGLFVLSLDLILGYAGIVSLGHAMFFGIGAYAAALLVQAGWTEPITGMIASGILAGLVGFLSSFVVLRTQQLALLMVTLALGLLFFELANSLHDITGGENGLRGIMTAPVLGLFEFDLWGRTAYAYSLVVFFAVFLFSRRLVNSPFGLSLRGIQDNPVRMAAIGVHFRSNLRMIYTISATIAGLAGALSSQTIFSASLFGLSFTRSAEAVVMLVVGGVGYLYGAVVGVAIYMIGRDQLSDMNPQYWYFWIGLLLMAIALFLPSGLLGGACRIFGKRK